MKVNFTLHTNGKGYWSDVKKSIKITKLCLCYVSDDKDDGSLDVYFSPNSWNTCNDGLIYTDPLFLSELKKALKNKGIIGDIDYSEQGMQGKRYVNFDVDGKFIASFRLANITDF